MRYCTPLPYNLIYVSGLFQTILLSKKPSNKEKILATISLYTTISENQMMSKSKKGEVTEARFLAMYFLSLYNPKMRLKAIGGMFNRHYSSVIYAKGKVEDWIKTDKLFKNMFQVLSAVLTNTPVLYI